MTTDIFLSHNWGKDDLGRNNHVRVSLINEELKKLGYKTWFDEERMSGDIDTKMVEVVEQCKGVIVFITKRYESKVGGMNLHDNCQREIKYAAIKKTSLKMVPVVMKQHMTDQRRWQGNIRLHLDGKIFIDMSGNFDNKCYVSEKMRLLQRELQFIGIKLSNTINRNNAKRLLTGIFVIILIFKIALELNFIFYSAQCFFKTVLK